MLHQFSSNGPNLVLEEMDEYLEKLGMPMAMINGEAERETRSLLKAMRVSKLKEKMASQANKCLQAYQSTNHTTTRVSSAELLFPEEN